MFLTFRWQVERFYVLENIVSPSYIFLIGKKKHFSGNSFEQVTLSLSESATDQAGDSNRPILKFYLLVVTSSKNLTLKSASTAPECGEAASISGAQRKETVL